MKRYISILRGINVGGHRRILMADLKVLYKDLGFINVRTYIQSGNVFFDTKKNENPKELVFVIGQKIKEVYGFEVPIIIRTGEEINKAIANNPFLPSEEPEKLFLTFLDQLPSDERLSIIKMIDHTPDKFEIIGDNIFGFCAGKYSNSKLTNQFFESKLKVHATTRNWKTVKQLAILASE